VSSIIIAEEPSMSQHQQHMLTRRIFLRLSAMTTVGAALAACAPAVAPGTGAQSSGEAEPVAITMWTWYGEQEQEFPKLTEEFNAANPGIVAESRIYGGDEYLQVLEAAIAGGKGPDILGPHVHAIEYGLAGQTIDLKEFLDEEFLGQFFESTRRQFTAEGKQYAIGWMAQTFGFFYNPPLFEAASAAIPETWDDLIAESDKIRTTDMIPWVFNEADKWLGADYFLPLITQVTDDPELVYLLDDHTQEGISWDSEPVIEALGLIDRLVKAQVFQEGVNGTDWSQSTGIFYSGRSAMFFAGSWVPQGIKTDAPPEFAESYRIFQTPAWAPGKRHWCGNQAGAALAVSAKGHVDESLKFIRFIYEPDRYSTTMNNSLSMPSTSTAAEKVEDPIMKEMTSWLVDGAPHILFGKGSWDAVGNAVQGVFGQLLTPEEAAAQMEADVVAARAR
jgi:ABC-type glycerol-3-phosphate transport system substrate-binding protein